MVKKIVYLTLFIFAFYAPSAFCEWVQVKSYEDSVIYVDTNISGKYWIRNYGVMRDYAKPKESFAGGPNKSYISTVQLKTLDCLFGNVAHRAIGFYSDYRWFQFDREYDDEVFEYVCGDLYTLRDKHLFRKIPRQSPM
jgi:hypothetical protein